MDIHAFFVPGAGFRAHTQGTGGAADAVPAEFRTFQEQVCGIRLDSLSRPPIMPARQEGPSLSAITSISLFKVWGFPSNVVMVSPSFARLTMIWAPRISRISKACIGWPVSSITKLVMSTMLLMGRIPALLMQRFIQSGDSLIRRLRTARPIYLGQRS